MTGVSPERSGTEREGRLDDRVIDVLLEHPGTVAFNGIRRALNAHPESLARALRRLERDGLVRRDREGYSAVLSDSEVRNAREDRPRTLVASLELPPGTTATEVFGALAGHWFGTLRWLGVQDRPGETALVWSVGGGQGHVLLSVRRSTLRVRVDAPRDQAGFPALERAAYDLLRYALAHLPPFRSVSVELPDTMTFQASAVPLVWN